MPPPRPARRRLHRQVGRVRQADPRARESRRARGLPADRGDDQVVVPLLLLQGPDPVPHVRLHSACGLRILPGGARAGRTWAESRVEGELRAPDECHGSAVEAGPLGLCEEGRGSRRHSDKSPSRRRKSAKPAGAPKPARPALRVPPALADALRKSAKLRAHWKAFPPSHRREYIEWLVGAKQEATRERRLARAIAQIGEGKSQ